MAEQSLLATLCQLCLYGSKTRGPEDDSLESKHAALISHYMFNVNTVVFD